MEVSSTSNSDLQLCPQHFRPVLHACLCCWVIKKKIHSKHTTVNNSLTQKEVHWGSALNHTGELWKQSWKCNCHYQELYLQLGVCLLCSNKAKWISAHIDKDLKSQMKSTNSHVWNIDQYQVKLILTSKRFNEICNKINNSFTQNVVWLINQQRLRLAVLGVPGAVFMGHYGVPAYPHVYQHHTVQLPHHNSCFLLLLALLAAFLSVFFLASFWSFPLASGLAAFPGYTWPSTVTSAQRSWATRKSLISQA